MSEKLLDKPDFCEEGFYNFDLANAFIKKNIIFSKNNYYFYKYKSLSNLNNHDKETSPKIALISHDIWLTSITNPRQLKQEHIELISRKISLIDTYNAEWLHILWTNCKSCL